MGQLAMHNSSPLHGHCPSNKSVPSADCTGCHAGFPHEVEFSLSISFLGSNLQVWPEYLERYIVNMNIVHILLSTQNVLGAFYLEMTVMKRKKKISLLFYSNP